MSHFLFCSTLYNTFLIYTQFCRSHFGIGSKFPRTFHYFYWNFDTPTPCLNLYSTAHWTKQTFAILKFQLCLSKTSFASEITIQKEAIISIIVKFQLSLNMSHFVLHDTLAIFTQFAKVTLCPPQQNFNTRFITSTEILTFYAMCHFYSTAHLTKQTLVMLKLQLGLAKSHLLFEKTIQNETIILSYNYIEISTLTVSF